MKRRRTTLHRRKSDTLWKVVLEDTIADLLRFIHPDADEVYDMERGFRFLDNELAELHPQPDEEKDTRFADKLVEVYHRDGQEECIFLHIEIQEDTHDPQAFAERMYTYFYRIRDRYPGKKLTALAIYTGRKGRSMPAWYKYEYRGTKLTYEYPTLSILDYSDEELENSSNPFAQVVQAARMRLLENKIPEEKLFDIKLLAAQKLRSRGFDERKVLVISNFLRNYVLFENPHLNRKFDILLRKTDKINNMNTEEYIKMEAMEEGLAKGLRKGRREGILEGKREGIQEATRSFVEYLLKNSDFPLEKIATSCKVTVDYVNNIKENKIVL